MQSVADDPELWRQSDIAFDLPLSISARVVDVDGDGNCLLYALMYATGDVEHDSTEEDAATQLRHLLKRHLIGNYNATSWGSRVPEVVQDPLTPKQYATKYLTKANSHLPSSAICVWQDLLHPSIQVYVLVHDKEDFSCDDDYVEVFRAPQQPPHHCIVLQRVWSRTVGHYAVVVAEGSYEFSLDDPLIQHVASVRHPSLTTREERKRKSQALKNPTAPSLFGPYKPKQKRVVIELHEEEDDVEEKAS
jgi:hypothetical protein